MKTKNIHSNESRRLASGVSEINNSSDALLKLSIQILHKVQEINSRLDVQEAILLELREQASLNQHSQSSNPEPIRGIHGLANFLGVSPVTAQKIKNSGKVPFAQFERVILFDREKVLQALEGNLKAAKTKKR